SYYSGYGARKPVEPTTRDDGRYAISLPAPARAARTVMIAYDGLHQIDDAARLLNIGRLPIENDPLQVGDEKYLFVKTAAASNQIEIANTRSEMAQAIADRINADS